MVREREHWMTLTRELNDRLMVLAERPWTLPPSATPPPELREPEPAYLFDPGPENEAP
jgi:hypothetical protein